MKTGLIFVIAVAALAGCSREGTRESSDMGGQRSSSSMTNEAAGAQNTNGPSMNAPPSTPSQPSETETNK